MALNAAQPQPDARVGEVVEATTTGFTTQCYRLYESPPLGSLVRGGDASAVYGIVYEVATRSMDPARHPIPRGGGEDTEEAVYLNNPQLNRLLITEFHSVIVGFRDAAPAAQPAISLQPELRRYLAPLPLRIHSFVYECGDDEVRAFGASLDFVPLILAAPTSAQDDVIASFLRQASLAHPDPHGFLVKAGKELAGHFTGQLQRLNNVLRRLSP